MKGASALAIEDESAALFDAIRAELLDEYRQAAPLALDHRLFRRQG
jgi:hypothetical protein